jgi:Rad9
MRPNSGQPVGSLVAVDFFLQWLRKCRPIFPRCLSNVIDLPTSFPTSQFKLSNRRLFFVAFTQALRCQSKFSEDLVISAEESKMCLIAMNQTKTSYCRVTFYRPFFEGVYRVGNRPPNSLNGKGKEREVDGTESDDTEELPLLQTQISVKVSVFATTFFFFSIRRLTDA